MFRMRPVSEQDISFWQSLDEHLPQSELRVKIAEQRCFLLLDDTTPIGVLRYNLFWDLIPFLTLIQLEEAYWRRGFGSEAMRFWEEKMRSSGYKLAMTSTMVDENAQHFYRRLGYKDCGCLVQDFEPYAGNMEMFMMKRLQ